MIRLVAIDMDGTLLRPDGIFQRGMCVRLKDLRLWEPSF